jgi:hypothetical protein
MFANPLLASKMRRLPEPSEPTITESFHTRAYEEKVPPLCLSLPDGSRLYQDDFIKLKGAAYAKVLRSRLDTKLVTHLDGRVVDISEVEKVVMARIPNPYRTRANGKAIIHIGMSLFSDATSGNTTSAWNYIDGWQMRVHSLPREYQDMRLLNCTRSHEWQPVMEAILKDLKN